MRVIKIFSPDILFSDKIVSCWVKNVKNIDGKLPIHQELKLSGIYAIDILPQHDDNDVDWFAISFPINRSWKPEDLTKSKSVTLSFDLITAAEIHLNIAVENDKNEQTKISTLKFSDSDNWGTTRVQLPKDMIKQILFSGAVTSSNFLMKNIIIEVDK